MTKAYRHRVVQLLMIGGLIACMSYSLLGAAIHEWLGTAVLAGFIWHLLRNRRWFSGLACGRWSASRLFSSALDGLLCFFTLGLVASSLMLSQYVFAFLPLDLPAGTGATPHQVCACWGFLAAALHLGRHHVRKQPLSPIICAAAFAGTFAFFWQALPARLLLQMQGMPAHQSLLLDFAANLLIFILFAILGTRRTRPRR